MSDNLFLSEFDYILPEEKIAYFPIEDKSKTKLLLYNNNAISDKNFTDISKLLPTDSLLVTNNTKVIPARLFFNNNTGAKIEILLLKSLEPNWQKWECMIGNKKKWKSNETIKSIYCTEKNHFLYASFVDLENNIIQFHSDENKPINFVEIIESLGSMPLPPYIKREAIKSDLQHYQPIFAKNKGAVAAPTASLHFTNNILEEIKKNNISICELTLHVGAGTFLPVKTNDIKSHTMHSEQFMISTELIVLLLNNTFITAVGTTVMRTVESIFYIGCKLILQEENPFTILQTDGYEKKYLSISKKESLLAIINYLEINQAEIIAGETAIYIYPGFRFQFCNAIITNFHQPKSTLLMLVEAFIGKAWKQLYEHALNNEYRFLSYGDACLFFRN